jgi:hypothetical protein
MAFVTLHDVATTPYPIGIECDHCMRHALLTATQAKATRGDMRTLEEAGVRCGNCGSRRFSTVRFDGRSQMIAFMRNL